MDKSRRKRMDFDVRKLSAKYRVNLMNGTKEFLVTLCGPSGSFYEGGIWAIHVDMPESYPFKSPSVGFLNCIFHPNVEESSGAVCLDVLNQKWSPIFDLTHIFDHFLPQLLQNPNVKDPLNQSAGKLCEKDYDKFGQRVKEYIEKYATADKAIKSMINALPEPPTYEDLMKQLLSAGAIHSNASASNSTLSVSIECIEGDNRDGSVSKKSGANDSLCSVASEAICANDNDQLDAKQRRLSTSTSISSLSCSIDDPMNIFEILGIKTTAQNDHPKAEPHSSSADGGVHAAAATDSNSDRPNNFCSSPKAQNDCHTIGGKFGARNYNNNNNNNYDEDLMNYSTNNIDGFNYDSEVKNIQQDDNDEDDEDDNCSDVSSMSEYCSQSDDSENICQKNDKNDKIGKK